MEPTSEATVKEYQACVVGIDHTAGTVTLETNHPEQGCKRLVLTAVQCGPARCTDCGQMSLPPLFTRGRVYLRITDTGVTWFFSAHRKSSL